MKFNCTLCGGKIEGEESWIGLESECPYCNMKITVPEPMVRNLPPLPPTPVAEVLPAEAEAVGAAADTAKVATFGGSASMAPVDVYGKWIIGGAIALVLLIIAVTGSGVLTREVSLLGYWEDTHGMNVRIEVKPNNLLVIYIPIPRGDGQGMSNEVIDIKGSYGPSDKDPTYILEGGAYHTCKLEGGDFVVDGLPFAGRTYHYRKRK